MSDGNRMDASYVLDWLRQSGAPENIVGLQEKVVEAAGGYVGAEDRGLREVFRSMERSGHIRVARADAALGPGQKVRIVAFTHPWQGRVGTIRGPLGGGRFDSKTATWEVVLDDGPHVAASGRELECVA